ANAVQAQEKEHEANQQRDEVRALNDQLRRTLYAAHMNLAQHAWQAGGIERVLELLDLHRPKGSETDLRHFEWYYLHRLCYQEILTLKWPKGQKGSALNVAYSPDGKRLATTSNTWDDKSVYLGSEVKVWDAQTGLELLSLKGGSPSGDWTNGVAFSPDG